jgi:hypothetical protein
MSMLISSSQFGSYIRIMHLLKSLHTTFFLLITDEMKVNLQYFDGRPMSGTVPQRVTCTVVEAQPNTKGLTAQPQ